jgi:diaminopimelate decarboxylase
MGGAMPRPDELVSAYGSPLFVYDLDRARAARSSLRATLPEPFTLFYSLKANPHPVLARALREGEGGCRAEVCSAGELTAAIEAGYPAGEILYGGPGKTEGELDLACRLGVREFSVESLPDLRRVGAVARRHGTTARCLLRINSATGAATTSIRMTGTPSQFGIDAETLPRLLPRLRSVPGTRLVGLHFFPLSNARDEESLTAEFSHSIETAAELAEKLDLPVRFLDIGGGFSAPYSVPGERPDYPKLRRNLEFVLDLYFPRWRDGVPRLACESGRYLVGDCGRLLCTVTNIKHSRGRKFLIMDAGINTMGGMAGLGRLLPLAITIEDPSGELSHPAASAGHPGTSRERVTLAGPLCTPGDLLGRDVAVPPLRVGSVVTVPNVGAYGLTASLVTFLSRPPAAEVFLSGGEVVAVSHLELRRTTVIPA